MPWQRPPLEPGVKCQEQYRTLSDALQPTPAAITSPKPASRHWNFEETLLGRIALRDSP
jgi:hypothetical protein